MHQAGSSCKSLLAVVIALATVCVKLAASLSLGPVQIPSLVQRGANFWLVCKYQLEGDESLYSVKWYKSNEEFYRLQDASSSASGGRQSELIVNHQPTAGNSSLRQSGYQQYFWQPGVNVLMSASNATHVRLLNASLESEGQFACEISTQNLSTIRYEKEIRVYVLPQTRLAVSGFKSRFGLGDSLELQCASDYARPKPVLAWFINGHRISPASQSQAMQAFQLESQTRSKLNEPTLWRSSLTLRFKLTSELISTLASLERNQSLRNTWPPSKQASSSGKFELRLQCKYKLAEVSAVTFNELLVGRSFSATEEEDDDAELPPLGLRQRRKSMTHASGGLLKLSKSSDGQVMQSKCPARREELRQTLAIGPANSSPVCQLGSLALQPEDPLIVTEERSTSEGPMGSQTAGEVLALDLRSSRQATGGRHADGRRRRTESRNTISVNCTTIGALLADQQEGQVVAVGDNLTEDTNSAVPALVCGELLARKRSLISGKYPPTEPEPQPTNQRQQHRNPQQQQQQRFANNKNQVAYLTLSQQKLSQLQLELNQPGAAAAEEPDSADTTSSTKHLHHKQQQLEAPPLLEWFINNQEGPKTSAKYANEMAASARRTMSTLADQSLDSPMEGAASANELADDQGDPAKRQTLAPSIDYVEYFANFDAKPVEQYLPLELRLEKHHFMTPDSNLRLRCSSTQAQVLGMETISLSIMAVHENQVRKSWNPRAHSNKDEVIASNQIRKQHRLPNQAQMASTNLHRGSNSSTSALEWPKVSRLASVWLSVIGLLVLALWRQE